MRSAPSFLFAFFFEKVGFFILFGANLVDWCCRLPAALFGKSQWLKTHRLSVWVCLRFEHISHCSARACGPHLNLHLGTWKKNLRISESNLTKVFRLPSSRAVSAARSCSPTALLKSDLLNFRSFHAQGTAEILRRDLSDVLEEDAFAVVSSLLWSAQTQGCQQLACPHKRLPCTCTHTWCYPHTQTCSSTCRFFEPCAPEPLTQLPNATLAESQRDKCRTSWYQRWPKQVYLEMVWKTASERKCRKTHVLSSWISKKACWLLPARGERKRAKRLVKPEKPWTGRCCDVIRYIRSLCPARLAAVEPLLGDKWEVIFSYLLVSKASASQAAIFEVKTGRSNRFNRRHIHRRIPWLQALLSHDRNIVVWCSVCSIFRSKWKLGSSDWKILVAISSMSSACKVHPWFCMTRQVVM